MDLTPYALWLNEVFSLFDAFLLGICHELAVSYGDVLTPIANVLDAAGHWGIAFVVLALILMCFRKTRMAGFAILVSIAISGGLSELVIKDIVARPRPFESLDLFNAWWQFVGSPSTSGTSFPSGHVAAATAAMIALAYAARHWWASLLGVIVIIAMAIDRMYLQVHYPSDVLAGFILGFFAGIVGYAIVQGVWRLLGEHPDQLAQAEARKAPRQYAQVSIPRGVDRMDYSAAGRTQATSARRQAAPTQRYRENTVPRTLETADGNRVVVPPMPAVPPAPNSGATQAIGRDAGTTQAIGRDAGTTQAIGRDAGTTQAIGRDAGTTQAIGRDAGTTQAIGGSAGATQAIGRGKDAGETGGN